MRATSCCSLLMFSRGVPAGTSIPYQFVMSKPGNPASAIAGKSGAIGERWGLVTPSARSLPALTSGSDCRMFMKYAEICPLIRSMIAVLGPL